MTMLMLAGLAIGALLAALTTTLAQRGAARRTCRAQGTGAHATQEHLDEAFNSAVGSMERQVRPGARKFTELGIGREREIDLLEPVDKLARELAAAPSAVDSNESSEQR